jgi:hypothetical protein
VSEREVVYVISSGEYSDYSVLCACPSKEDAETLVSRMNAAGGSPYRGDCVVEELAMLPADAQQVEILHMSVTLWDDGRQADEHQHRQVEWPLGYYVPVRWRWVRAPMHRDKGGRLEVSGTDHERVRKVYGDRRALLLSDDAFRAQREVAG